MLSNECDALQMGDAGNCQGIGIVNAISEQHVIGCVGSSGV
ncbi:hypothetical protein [uncultured Bifidobacterium sp.]|nr:hypothetical protein [uncultured Bifidobacterium sp.]